MHSHNAPAISNNGLSYKQLVDLFNQLFLASERTQLKSGHPEPLYTPALKNQPAKIFFRQDYPSSALHEVAHWCIAGQSRRKQTDYGYWYRPEGRSAEEQTEFEKVEVKPQALEWVFSRAAGVRFNLSADNLTADISTNRNFALAVVQQAREYLMTEMPDRAGIFYRALLATTGYPAPTAELFELTHLGFPDA